MAEYFEKPVKEFEEKVIQVSRVSKKTKGGNRMSFSALVAVGDKKGRVGIGFGKAPDVASAVRKANSYATKHMISVVMRDSTIPHEIRIKNGASVVLLKPAPAGSGVIAGGAVRPVLEVAGIKDVVGKILGSNNKIANVYSTFTALSKLRKI